MQWGLRCSSESVMHLSYGLIVGAGMNLGLFLLKQIPSSLHASVTLLFSYKKLIAVKKVYKKCCL